MFKAILVILILLPVTVFADTFFVDKVTNTGASLDEVSSSIHVLTKNEVVSQGHVVVEDLGSSQWALKPSILKLGDSYILTMARSENGRILFSDKLKADSLADIERVIERLVRAALGSKKAVNTEAVDLRNKREVTKEMFVGFGPGYLSGLNADSPGRNWVIGYLLGLDPQFALRINLEGLNVGDSDADMVMLGLGGQYYLNNLKHAPYVLGLIGYSWSDSEDPSHCSVCTGESNHGWGIEAGVGMHFYRNSVVNLALEFSHTRAFYNVVGEGSSTTALKLVILWQQ